MSAPLRLVIFDVDGTLVDSQAHIVAAMAAAFRRRRPAGAGAGRDPVHRRAVAAGGDCPAGAGSGRRDAGADRGGLPGRLRAAAQADGAALSPLYPGARAVLEALAGQADVLLGIATGKSRRGMAHLMELHGLGGSFKRCRWPTTTRRSRTRR